jgi:hypothetical protein
MGWTRGTLDAVVGLEVKVCIVWACDDAIDQVPGLVLPLLFWASPVLVGKNRVLWRFVTITAVNLKSGTFTFAR